MLHFFAAQAVICWSFGLEQSRAKKVFGTLRFERCIMTLLPIACVLRYGPKSEARGKNRFVFLICHSARKNWEDHKLKLVLHASKTSNFGNTCSSNYFHYTWHLAKVLQFQDISLSFCRAFYFSPLFHEIAKIKLILPKCNWSFFKAICQIFFCQIVVSSAYFCFDFRHLTIFFFCQMTVLIKRLEKYFWEVDN